MPITASLIAGGVLAAGQVGMGVAQYVQGRKAAKNNVRPEYQVQNEFQRNLDTTRYMAQRGLGEKALEYYNTNSDRGLQSTIDAQLRTGASPNSVTQAYDTYNQGLLKVAAVDSQAWTENVNAAIKANYAMAEEKSHEWAINQYEKFKDAAQATSAQKSAGVNNMFKGANAAVSALSNYGISQLYAPQTPKIPQAPMGAEDMQQTAIKAANDYFSNRALYKPNNGDNGSVSSMVVPRVDMATFDWNNYISGSKQNIPNTDNTNTQVKSNTY
jgi:hypothetical protein